MLASAVQTTPSGAPAGVPNPGPEPGTLAVANAALRGGFVLLPRTLLHALGLSRDAKLLYAVLLSYAWQAGSCFPGAERLQHDLGCGKNQVTRYLQELEVAGLVTRQRRGQGKTTRYTLHDVQAVAAAAAPAADSPEAGIRVPRNGASRLPELGNQDSPKRGAEYDSAEQDPAEQHHQPMAAALPPKAVEPPDTLAPTVSAVQPPAGAGDDDALQSLLSQGVTRRIAEDLVRTHGAQAVRQQLQWQASRPAVTSPAGALVRAIRDAWPPPPAWLEAQERAAALARADEEGVRQREEEEARRREQAARPPEERIAGRLQFWVAGQRAKRREPTPAEIATRRAELLAELVGG